MNGGQLPTPRLSASIGGAKTNRVKVSKRRPSREPKRFRRSAGRMGRGRAVACISMSADELRAIDAACDRLKVSRSEFMGAAAQARAASVATASTTRGVKRVNVSLPPDDLAVVDATAAALKVSRSQFLVDAAIAKVRP